MTVNVKKAIEKIYNNEPLANSTKTSKPIIP